MCRRLQADRTGPPRSSSRPLRTSVTAVSVSAAVSGPAPAGPCLRVGGGRRWRGSGGGVSGVRATPPPAPTLRDSGKGSLELVLIMSLDPVATVERSVAMVSQTQPCVTSSNATVQAVRPISITQSFSCEMFGNVPKLGKYLKYDGVDFGFFFWNRACCR